jgi:hypothetical protein
VGEVNEEVSKTARREFVIPSGARDLSCLAEPTRDPSEYLGMLGMTSTLFVDASML